MTDSVTATTPGASPEALLKQAVSGGKAKAALAPATPARTASRRPDPRMAGLAGAALVLGLTLGAGGALLATTRGDHATDAAVKVQAHLASGQAETAHLRGEIERLARILGQTQESTETARTEAKARSLALTERVARAEQAVTARIAAMGDRLDAAEKDQTGRITALSAQLERKPSAPTPPAPQAAKTAPEPTETGAIAEVKAKPAVNENWAVREVYDGIAMLEDRKRRLVEVGPGDTIPGAGRVETIERRGRTWVVVTKQGLITSQTW